MTKKRLLQLIGHVKNPKNEVELDIAPFEHKEPIFVDFFCYAKLRTMKLCYNCFTNFCGVNKFKQLEKDTDSLSLAVAQKELRNCSRPERKAEWE